MMKSDAIERDEEDTFTDDGTRVRVDDTTGHNVIRSSLVPPEQGREPYLVVSDVHLGSDECCRKEFADFLDWMADWQSAGETVVETDEGPLTLVPPQTLILLGDILELWAPRNAERNNVIQDSISIFSKLIDLDCQKVYVLGNHDMMLCGGYERRGATLIDFVCKNAARFEVFPRHYPCDPQTPRVQLLSLRERKYLFVHGHQFDPEFRRAGGSMKFVPLIAGLASSFDIVPAFGPVCLVLSLISIGLLVASLSHVTPVDPVWWVALLIAVGYPGFSWIIAKEMKHVWNFTQSLTAFTRSDPCQKDVSSWPWPWHKRSGMRYTQISDFVRDSAYFDLNKDDSKPDVIVFGHTHVPEMCKPLLVDTSDPLSERQFINSGSWLRPSHDWDILQPTTKGVSRDCPKVTTHDGKPLYNTFVYISEEHGALLFQWRDSDTPAERKAIQIPPEDCDDTSSAADTGKRARSSSD
jgi:UDP-2,3-diacylglucosamine pyrophosphatase LpxH